MATILSEEEIQNLLEDRRNGMGLQKVARKYRIGIPKIRKIEQENGLEIAIPEAAPTTDLQKHFLEVQDSFAIVLDDLQANKIELLQAIAAAKEEIQSTKKELLDNLQSIEDASILEDDTESIQEDIADVDKKIDWQLAANIVFGGIAIAAIVWGRRKEKPKPVVYYSPPTHTEKPREQSKIPQME